MILPDFILPSRVNQCWQYSGIDSIEHCLDKQHFKQYPYPITYNYNSRGFRDAEWPDTLEQLQNAVWCVGDSFTVGLGSPLEHTWAYQVGQQLEKRTINISMDGASNQWIARKTIDIIKNIAPTTIIIQWSYLHRYEIDDPTLSDESRRGHFCPTNWDDEEKKLKFITLVKQIELAKQKTKIVHSFIPDLANTIDTKLCWSQISGPDWPTCPLNLEEFKALDSNIVNELVNDFELYNILKAHYTYVDQLYSNIKHIPEIQRLDWARDKHHYDLLTANKFAIDVRELLLNWSS